MYKSDGDDDNVCNSYKEVGNNSDDQVKDNYGAWNNNNHDQVLENAIAMKMRMTMMMWAILITTHNDW